MATALVIENQDLAGELQRVWKVLDNVRNRFLDLQDRFERSKRRCPITRYGTLKTLIRNVTTDDIIRQLTDVCGKSLPTPVSKLREYVSNLAKLAEIKQRQKEVKDYKPLKNKDIQRNNQQKNRVLERFKKVATDVLECIQQLKVDYEESKRYLPCSRYKLMKAMIECAVDDVIRHMRYVHENKPEQFRSITD